MIYQQTIGARIRSSLLHLVTGLLLGALAFSFAWTAGLAMNALRFTLIVLGAMFVLRYMTPLRKANWIMLVGVILGVLLVVVQPNLSLASLGTEQLALVIVMLWLMR